MIRIEQSHNRKIARIQNSKYDESIEGSNLRRSYVRTYCNITRSSHIRLGRYIASRYWRCNIHPNYIVWWGPYNKDGEYIGRI